MSIGENIRYLRKKSGFTQKELAHAVGVNEVTIRSYEAGKYMPKTDVLYKLCGALECNINEILDKPFDLMEKIYINLNSLDELPEKYKELTGKTLKSDLIPDGVISLSEFQKEVFIKNLEEENKLLENYRLLNSAGKAEAQKRIEELTEIKKYTEEDMPDIY